MGSSNIQWGATGPCSPIPRRHFVLLVSLSLSLSGYLSLCLMAVTADAAGRVFRHPMHANEYSIARRVAVTGGVGGAVY